MPDRTLEGHNRPAVAPPQRLRAPLTIRLCLFLGGGLVLNSSYLFLARDNFVCLFLLFCLSRALNSNQGVRPSHHLALVLYLRGRQTTDDDPITAKEPGGLVVVHAVVPRPSAYVNIVISK